MKKYICHILLLITISCNDTSKSVISKKINKECIEQNCEINMSRIITEDWDYVYIFRINNSLEEINNQLGFQYLYFEDIATRIIFVKNKTVVYHEDEFPNPEKVKQNEYFNALQVKFSYAVTCHKAQGGQWESVFVEQPYLPDGIDVDYVRWLYTAITRAEEKLYLIGFKDEFFEN